MELGGKQTGVLGGELPAQPSNDGCPLGRNHFWVPFRDWWTVRCTACGLTVRRTT